MSNYTENWAGPCRPCGNLLGKILPNCRGVIDPVAFFETESLSWQAAVARRRCRHRDLSRPTSVRTADGGDSREHSIRRE
jgi:hypothetical protein